MLMPDDVGPELELHDGGTTSKPLGGRTPVATAQCPNLHPNRVQKAAKFIGMTVELPGRASGVGSSSETS